MADSIKETISRYNPIDQAARAMRGESEPQRSTPAREHDSGKVNMEREAQGAVNRQRNYEREEMQSMRPAIRKTPRKVGNGRR
jgi:hypothetical protein